jgi:hypothetical protein
MKSPAAELMLTLENTSLSYSHNHHTPEIRIFQRNDAVRKRREEAM